MLYTKQVALKNFVKEPTLESAKFKFKKNNTRNFAPEIIARVMEG